jgi:hypothetical protein
MKKDLALFVHWQDPVTRRWHVVGRLTRIDELYRFVYTKGAIASERFTPFGRMTELRHEYQSFELFPLFSNRILQKSRPEYRNYLNWLAMDEGNVDPLVLLGRSGGLRGTDTLSMYPAPVPDSENNYRVTFFCHGMRYTSRLGEDGIKGMSVGNTLYPMHDMQNPSDKHAIALRTADPARMIGYCPRFFAKDFGFLLKTYPKNANVTVVRVNHDAPIDFRLLCEFKSPWPKNFRACDDAEFKPLSKRALPHPVAKPMKSKKLTWI